MMMMGSSKPVAMCVMRMMMMMGSSKPVATMVTLINHATLHVKTLISMEHLNTLMILFLLIEALGT
jgi:hypothetical protein